MDTSAPQDPTVLNSSRVRGDLSTPSVFTSLEKGPNTSTRPSWTCRDSPKMGFGSHHYPVPSTPVRPGTTSVSDVFSLIGHPVVGLRLRPRAPSYHPTV